MEVEPYSDEQIMAILDQQILKQPEITCPEGHVVASICLSKHCQASLFCSNDRCKVCSNRHRGCRTTKISQLTQQLNQQVYSCKDLFFRIAQIENQLITTLKQSQRQMLKNYFTSLFSPHDKAIIDSLFRHQRGRVNGQAAGKLKNNIERANKNLYEVVTNKVRLYGRQVKKMSENLLKIKDSFYPQRQNEKYQNSESEMIQKQSNNIVYNNLMKQFSLQKASKSVILNSQNPQASNKLNYLMRQLDYPQKLQLLFRASSYNFSASSFHKKCDNVQNTLVLVRTQFGKTIAGFTKHKWNAVKEKYVGGSKNHTFLLQIDLKQKYVPYNPHQLIYCSRQLGPTFGDGPDLCLVDQCHIKQAESSFPSTFNMPEGRKYPEFSRLSYQAFTGSKTNKFKVLEYEVFRVISSAQQQKLKIDDASRLDAQRVQRTVIRRRQVHQDQCPIQ